MSTRKPTLGDMIPVEKIKELESKTTETSTNDERHRRNGIRYAHPQNIKDALKVYPEHIVKLVNIVKSNRDICRYTSLGILNYLKQVNIINTTNGFVTFNWTKFRVSTNGLNIEYRYTEAFFINCLVASFTSFANAATKVIKTFCSKEFSEEFVQDDNVITEAIENAENADKIAEEKEHYEKSLNNTDNKDN